MSKKLLVSIITPSYNGSAYLEHCINSIKNQTYGNVEHIIIDGGSTDGTIEILKKHENTYNMTWVSEPDNGMYDAILKGFDLASGQIMAWLNTDDMYFPWAIEVVVKTMEEYEIDWVTGIQGFLNASGLYYGLPIFPTVYSKYFISKGYYHGKGLGFIQQESTFWTRSLWDRAIDRRILSKYKYAGDFYIWRGFSKYANLYSINTVLAGFRIHDKQKTANAENYYAEIKHFINYKSRLLQMLNRLNFINNIILIVNKNNFINLQKAKYIKES